MFWISVNRCQAICPISRFQLSEHAWKLALLLASSTMKHFANLKKSHPTGLEPAIPGLHSWSADPVRRPMPYPLGHGGTGIKCHDERKNRTISISSIRISQQLLQMSLYHMYEWQACYCWDFVEQGQLKSYVCCLLFYFLVVVAKANTAITVQYT